MSIRSRLPVLLAEAFAADDDRALVRRFAESHDEAAFTTVVARHARMVYGVCRRAVRDEHLAEDAFQAVFLVLAKNPARAAQADAVGGWLFGIARRVGMAARRREERYARRQLNPERQRRGDEPPDFDDLLRVLDEELATLPEIYRAPLVACFLEERTQDEAALHLGWSLSTLRRRLDRGKKMLHARLSRRGATLAGGLFAGVLAPSARAAVPTRLLEATALGVKPAPIAATLAAEAARGSAAWKIGLAAVAVALSLGGLAMCFGGERGEPEIAGQTRPPQLEVAPAPRPAESKKWVVVRGRVVLPEDRDLPLLRAVDPSGIKDVDFFGNTVFHQDVLIDPQTRGLANAVVWLRPDSDDKQAAFPADRIYPDLLDREPVEHSIQMTRNGFAPRVTAIRAGDTLVFANPTGIGFNVHYQPVMPSPAAPMGWESGEFNILLQRGRSHTTKRIPATSIANTLTDHIHSWIVGRVWAFDHPYFAVTDDKGRFEIKHAPPGKWRLVVWHETVGYRFGAKGRLGEAIEIATSMEMKPLALESDGWGER